MGGVISEFAIRLGCLNGEGGAGAGESATLHQHRLADLEELFADLSRSPAVGRVLRRHSGFRAALDNPATDPDGRREQYERLYAQLNASPLLGRLLRRYAVFRAAEPATWAARWAVRRPRSRGRQLLDSVVGALVPLALTAPRAAAGGRVVHVSPAYFDPCSMIGGGERYVQSLAAAMAERVDCSLVSFGPARETRRIGRLRLEIFPHIELIGGSLIDPLAYSFLTELDGAGVVHCHQHVNAVSALAIAAGRAAGARVFATDLGGAGTDLTRKYPLFELLDGFLAISRFSADRLPAHPNKRVIWGGVDEHLLAPAGPARRDRVVCVARLLPHKGIDCLIDAVDADTPLDLVGRPYHADYYALLRRRAKGKQVRFVTDATDEDVGRAYRAAGVVVLPSVYRDVWGHTHPNAELFGLALAEGMATGAPAVCTAVGAMPEVVEHGVTGFVVPPNDPAALGGRIRQLLKDTEAARAMGAAARRRVLERFTWGAVVEQCLAAYAGAGAHPQWERGAGA